MLDSDRSIEDIRNSVQTYIVLLRGVNVGGKNIIRMKELKALLEGHGFKKVTSYIQSGNIVLTADSNPESTIKHIIQENFGFTPDVMVLSKESFNAIVRNNPYQKHEPKWVHFYVCQSVPVLDIAAVEKYVSATEQYELIDTVFYLHAPEGIGRSTLVKKVEACLGVSATGRNGNTINKLSDIVGVL